MSPDDPGVEFTDSERRELLEMLEDYKRMRWLWLLIPSLAKWITAVTGAIIAIKWGLAAKWRPWP